MKYAREIADAMIHFATGAFARFPIFHSSFVPRNQRIIINLLLRYYNAGYIAGLHLKVARNVANFY